MPKIPILLLQKLCKMMYMKPALYHIISDPGIRWSDVICLLHLHVGLKGCSDVMDKCILTTAILCRKLGSISVKSYPNFLHHEETTLRLETCSYYLCRMYCAVLYSAVTYRTVLYIAVTYCTVRYGTVPCRDTAFWLELGTVGLTGAVSVSKIKWNKGGYK